MFSVRRVGTDLEVFFWGTKTFWKDPGVQFLSVAPLELDKICLKNTVDSESSYEGDKEINLSDNSNNRIIYLYYFDIN